MCSSASHETSASPFPCSIAALTVGVKQDVLYVNLNIIVPPPPLSVLKINLVHVIYLELYTMLNQKKKKKPLKKQNKSQAHLLSVVKLEASSCPCV